MSRPKIGIVFSAFDLLHAGHVMMLQTAKENCDLLIACIQTDPSLERPEKSQPIQSLFERYVQLDSNKDVDIIIPYTYEFEIIQILNSYKPSVRFLGDDYIEKDFTGKKLCEELNTKIIYIPRSHGFSSTELKNRIKTLFD